MVDPDDYEIGFDVDERLHVLATLPTDLSGGYELVCAQYIRAGDAVVLINSLCAAGMFRQEDFSIMRASPKP